MYFVLFIIFTLCGNLIFAKPTINKQYYNEDMIEDSHYKKQIGELLNLLKQQDANKEAKYLLMNSSPIFKHFLSKKNVSIETLDDLVNHYTQYQDEKKLSNFILKNNDFTWSFYSMSNHVGDIVVWETIKTAFDIWSTITNNNFKYSPNDYQTDFNIGFVKPYHHTSIGTNCEVFKSSTLAHAYFPETHYAGEIHFNDDQIFFHEKNEYSYSLLHVAIHEIGHSLGSRHNNRKTSIMYPESPPNKHLNLNLKFFDKNDIDQFK